VAIPAPAAARPGGPAPATAGLVLRAEEAARRRHFDSPGNGGGWRGHQRWRQARQPAVLPALAGSGGSVQATEGACGQGRRVSGRRRGCGKEGGEGAARIYI
jgi:hypothetical protein